jgi:hypothetical protein
MAAVASWARAPPPPPPPPGKTRAATESAKPRRQVAAIAIVKRGFFMSAISRKIANLENMPLQYRSCYVVGQPDPRCQKTASPPTVGRERDQPAGRRRLRQWGISMRRARPPEERPSPPPGWDAVFPLEFRTVCAIREIGSSVCRRDALSRVWNERGESPKYRSDRAVVD